MKTLELLKKALLRNFHFYLIVALFIYITLSFLTWASLDPWFITLMVVIIIMFMGQVFVITPFSLAYRFYLVSCQVSIAYSMLIWISHHPPFIDIYVIIVGALVLIIYFFHTWTREWLRTFPMTQVFSIFFFGLLIVLSDPKATPTTSYDMLFGLTIALFTLVAILGLNMAYRTMTLNKELKISDRIEYVRICKEKLVRKYEDAEADIDLLMYYFSSSLDYFIEGDFEKSFMEAYKIVFDSRGTAFKTIYTLPNVEERGKGVTEIRNILSHAHVKSKPKEEKESEVEELQKLKKVKKKLFDETLSLLKTVRFEFIEPALKGA